jgi:hypothetical protein
MMERFTDTAATNIAGTDEEADMSSDGRPCNDRILRRRRKRSLTRIERPARERRKKQRVGAGITVTSAEGGSGTRMEEGVITRWGPRARRIVKVFSPRMDRGWRHCLTGWIRTTTVR